MKNRFLDDHLLFENDDILVINKPSGISTLEDRLDATNVLSKVKEGYPQIKNCHRLDKYTSGALLFAKNPETYRTISLQFQNRKVKKIYHALVHGHPNFLDFEVNVPLIIKNNGNVAYDTRKGKESNTFFTTRKKFKNCSLVECRPVSGRKHQIRVHLKYAKHPIVGDSEYGGDFIYLSQLKRNYKQTHDQERPLINRMALHAFSLSFNLPDGDPISVEAPYPKDFKVLLHQLNKYG